MRNFYKFTLMALLVKAIFKPGPIDCRFALTRLALRGRLPLRQAGLQKIFLLLNCCSLCLLVAGERAVQVVGFFIFFNRDLPKLGQLDSSIEFRATLIVDGKEYLNGIYNKCRRLDYLIEKRNQIASGVHIFIMTFTDGNWNIQHIP